MGTDIEVCVASATPTAATLIFASLGPQEDNMIVASKTNTPTRFMTNLVPRSSITIHPLPADRVQIEISVTSPDVIHIRAYQAHQSFDHG